MAAMIATTLIAPVGFANDEGIYIETLNRSSGLTSETPREELSKTYVAHDKMKVVSGDAGGSDMILDPASGNMTFLNHADKEYYQINVQSVAKSMAEPGMEQMRAMMEQSKVSVVATGENKRIGNWDCEKYKVTKTGMMEIEQEIWAAKSIEFDFKPYTDMMSMSGPEGLLGDSAAGQAQQVEMDKIKGYPILTKSKMKMMGSSMESESEVKVIRKEPVAASFFEIPADYKLKEMGAPTAAGAHP